MWRGGGYLDRLAEFRLVMLDHRGRGGSDRPAGLDRHRLSQYVADVSALADELGLKRYGFFGYSFGGLVGLRLAAADSRVAALVVLGTVFDPPDSQPVTSAYRPAVQANGMRGLAETIEDLEGIVLPEWLLAEFTDTDPGQFELTLAANAGQPDPWDALPLIGAPAALIAGSEEDPEGITQQMAAAMPDAVATRLEGVGHVGAFLRPAEVARAALTPLRRAAAAASAG